MKVLWNVLIFLSDVLSVGEDFFVLFELGDEDLLFVDEIRLEFEFFEFRFDEFEFKVFFDGFYDVVGVMILINVWDGGIDVNDWVEMLLRMYI